MSSVSSGVGNGLLELFGWKDEGPFGMPSTLMISSKSGIIDPRDVVACLRHEGKMLEFSCTGCDGLFCILCLPEHQDGHHVPIYKSLEQAAVTMRNFIEASLQNLMWKQMEAFDHLYETLRKAFDANDGAPNPKNYKIRRDRADSLKKHAVAIGAFVKELRRFITEDSDVEILLYQGVYKKTYLELIDVHAGLMGNSDCVRHNEEDSSFNLDDFVAAASSSPLYRTSNEELLPEILEVDLRMKNSSPLPIFPEIIVKDIKMDFMNGTEVPPSIVGKIVPTVISSAPPSLRKILVGHEFGAFCSEAVVSGVATNGKLVYAVDSSNRRVIVFDESGNWINTIDRHDAIFCPNRVAVLSTGHVVVTEKSPGCQVSVYDVNCKFILAFGRDMLMNPRDVTTDKQDHIIVLESRIMRITIFSSDGRVIKSFQGKSLSFPNCVAVSRMYEIFVSDNHAQQGVHVFDYDGNPLRSIGHELLEYPIGLAIDPEGFLLVAGNHNKFNILKLSPKDASCVAYYESDVKHIKCFDFTLNSNNRTIYLACSRTALFTYILK